MAGVTVQINTFRQLSEGGDFLGDLAGHQMTGQARFGAYAASKFAAIGFTQTTDAEGQPYGVKASVVCPGPVDTVMRRENHPNDILENLTQPEEVADAILFLVCQSPTVHTQELIVRTPLNVHSNK